MTTLERAYAVLLRQPMVKRGYGWQAQKRNRYRIWFSHHTIKRLIALGLALRCGDKVAAVVVANDNRRICGP